MLTIIMIVIILIVVVIKYKRWERLKERCKAEVKVEVVKVLTKGEALYKPIYKIISSDMKGITEGFLVTSAKYTISPTVEGQEETIWLNPANIEEFIKEDERDLKIKVVNVEVIVVILLAIIMIAIDIAL